MTAPPAVTVRTPGEIAALVPYLTGFVPSESLVAVGLRGPRQRVGLTVRADLDDLAAGCGQVVDALAGDRARSCVLVVLTAEASGSRHPRAQLVRSVEDGLAARGVAVVEALLVRDGRWWSYRCAGPCCPPAGTPLDTASPAVRATAAAQAYGGQVVLGSREELVASLQPRPPLGAALAGRLQAQARDGLDVRVAADRKGAHAEELERWRVALDAWERCPGPLPPADSAALAAGLHLVPVRDTVASWGLTRYDGLLGVLLQLCRAVPPPGDAPLCAVLAWVAYSRGNGALALIAVQRALASDPSSSLARLLLAAVDERLPPAQVRAALRQAG